MLSAPLASLSCTVLSSTRPTTLTMSFCAAASDLNEEMISIILDALASIGLRSNCGVGAISLRSSYSETEAFIERFCAVQRGKMSKGEDIKRLYKKRASGVSIQSMLTCREDERNLGQTNSPPDTSKGSFSRLSCQFLSFCILILQYLKANTSCCGF